MCSGWTLAVAAAASGAAGCGRVAFDARVGVDAAAGAGDGGDAEGADACPAQGSQQLVENGGFETGDLTGWFTRNPSVGSAAVDTGTQVSGTFSVRMTPASTAFAGYNIERSIPVIARAQYVFSGYLNVEQLSAGQGGYLDLNDASYEVNLGVPAGTSGWRFVWGTVDIPDGVASVVVRVVHDGDLDPADHLFADDIAFTPSGEFVPPAPCP